MRRMLLYWESGLDNPLAHEYHVDRPALRRRMDEGLPLPLTLLVAPAGSGKTVLMQQWAESHPLLPLVWIDVGLSTAT
jgi:ATP/maltotriose-dependent transcriptional regulator MalT